MSTFSGLNTAYTGLVAARLAIDTVGQNISNSTTVGYSRQRVTSFALGSVSATPLSGGAAAGQGVGIAGISRAENAMLASRAASSAASSAYWTARSAGISTIDTGLNEPGTDGLSASLQNFWASWQAVSNYPSDPGTASALLESASTLSAKIASGYSAVNDEWKLQRADAVSTVATINTVAAQVAQLNTQIQKTTAGGTDANELLDQRDQLVQQLATLTGGSARTRSDGLIDVVVDGNALVSGTTSRAFVLTGPTELAGTSSTSRVAVAWAEDPTRPVDVSSGTLAGTVSLLGPASDGDPGSFSVAAESYNTLATTLAAAVNAVHASGATADGTTGHDFFAFTTGLPAAVGLRVVPTNASGLATATPGSGAANGAIADTIAQIGSASSGPDAVWSQFVVGIGVTSSTATTQEKLAGLAATSAQQEQLSESSVDLDEETMSLLTYQHAYEGAARVMTAIDELLDTLINRTGQVGR